MAKKFENIGPKKELLIAVKEKVSLSRKQKKPFLETSVAQEFRRT